MTGSRRIYGMYFRIGAIVPVRLGFVAAMCSKLNGQ